jgi:hypothetical protein
MFVLVALDEVKCGISVHPSHTRICGLLGEEERVILQQVSHLSCSKSVIFLAAIQSSFLLQVSHLFILQQVSHFLEASQSPFCLLVSPLVILQQVRRLVPAEC